MEEDREKQEDREKAEDTETEGKREKGRVEKEKDGEVQMHERRIIVGPVQDKVYPAPLHSHGELVGNKDAFMDDLRCFHASMGTRFMIPVIGGKDLDLHLLYVQVTGRGGLEKVILERRWKEVIAVFNFPATTTSASFVLRKYYLSLLYHFEQVYYFRAQGPLIPPAAALQTKTPLSKQDRNQVVLDSTMAKWRRKRVHSETEVERFRALDSNGNGTAETISGYPPSPPCTGRRPTSGLADLPVTGRIDGKCEFGYFVTVTIGAQTLKGVLYHPAEQPVGDSSSTDTDNDLVLREPRRQALRRRRGYRNWDPNHPKPNRSGYNFFFQEKHAELKLQCPNKEREYIKMIGAAWRELSEEKKMVYAETARADKERYTREMQEYRDTIKPAHLKWKGKEAETAGPSSVIADKTE